MLGYRPPGPPISGLPNHDPPTYAYVQQDAGKGGNLWWRPRETESERYRREAEEQRIGEQYAALVQAQRAGILSTTFQEPDRVSKAPSQEVSCLMKQQAEEI